MKLINNNPIGYPEKRNIVVFGQNKIVQVFDVFNFLNKLNHLITGKGFSLFLKGFFYSPFNRKIPAHFFNSINLGSNNWVVTFETTLPRLGNVSNIWYKIAVKQLAKNGCKKIIAISDCAYWRQKQFIKENFLEYYDDIIAKTVVLHPPQRCLIKEYSEKKNPSNNIVFTIVGADFFRKGGREVLNVFDKLLTQKHNIVLNIVSSLEYDDYATNSTIEERDIAINIIKKYPNNIIHYTSLSNDNVLELLLSTHIGLLPTWADTYGYFVLESQAAGCPAITTNVRALPEINNESCGWVLEMPLNDKYDADINSKEKKVFFQQLLEKKLEHCILEIISNPNIIELKGKKALDRIKVFHSPEQYKKKLLDIYNEFNFCE
jgi:glycosyltransferase involved in cell wall biosynthesis